MTDTIDATPTALDLPTCSADPSEPQLPPAASHLPSAPLPLPAPSTPGTAPEQADAITPAPTPSGPAATSCADPVLVPDELGVPTLPPSAPAAPSPGAMASVRDEHLAIETPAGKAPTGRAGRVLARLFMVVVLGAGVWAAATYGPGLYEQYVSETDPNGPPEPEAPLAFPSPSVPDTPIRTAEFVLDGLPGTPGITYRVTTDFDTMVSRVDLTRDDGPDLQILTYGDDAMIRRADGVQWYLLDRGRFPLDGRLERADWVRRLDEILPPESRDRVEITKSSDIMVAGVSTRHLTLNVDASLISAPPSNARSASDMSSPTDVGPGAEPGGLGGSAVTPPSAAVGFPSEPPVATAPSTGLVELELWIDDSGLVRQISGAPMLGAEIITIVHTSTEAWIPAYPLPEEISPLTASALLDLGL